MPLRVEEMREPITGFTGGAIHLRGRLPRVRRSDGGRPPIPSGPAGAAGRRLYAAPAARLTAVIAAAILVVALIAGAVRILPLVLAPGVPLRLVPVLVRGVAGVAFETALFVAPPIAWALAASRLADRGEARALFAVGVRPARVVASAWPAALGAALAAALASAAWGREASSPGRAVRDLLAEARAACLAAPPPAAADVPLLGVSWVCLPGEPPRAVLPVGRGALSAASIVVSDDLRALDATDLDLVLPPAAAGANHDAGPPEARVHAAAASVRGLLPPAPSSNLAPAARAALLAASTALLALAAGALALAAALRARTAALALGASGPAAALLVFSALERAPSPPAAYAAVPLAGLAALLAAFALARRASARAR